MEKLPHIISSSRGGAFHRNCNSFPLRNEMCDEERQTVIKIVVSGLKCSIWRGFFIPFEILLQPFCLHNNVSVVRNALIMTPPFHGPICSSLDGSKKPKRAVGWHLTTPNNNPLTKNGSHSVSLRLWRDYNLNKMSWKWDIMVYYKKRKPDTVVLPLIDMYPCQFFIQWLKFKCMRVEYV